MLTLVHTDHEKFESLYAPPTDIASIAWLEQAYLAQLDLCHELEEIADSLPAGIERQKCIHAAGVIGPLTKGIHKYEEAVLFPWIAQNVQSSPELASTLERLKLEHCEDECFAEELVDALVKLGKGDRDIHPEAVGYMLRGFFVGTRRHIAFEREYLMSLVSLPRTD